LLQGDKHPGPCIPDISLDSAEDKGPHVLLPPLFLVLAMIYNEVMDVTEPSLTSVLNLLRRIRITFLVSRRNMVKRQDAKGDDK